ncbi:MAG: hypothetical protein IT196_05285 [Acidimicrobiales bacterium]|nr:hypothetical protein [Acidimicrobiales bacterium]
MGAVRLATEVRIEQLHDPDVALVALALRLADLLDGDEPTAAAAKEYRATITALTVDAARDLSLEDLLDAEELPR